MWAFEFVIVLGLAISLAMGHLRSTRVMWTGLLAVVCVLKILGSDTFLCAAPLSGHPCVLTYVSAVNVDIMLLVCDPLWLALV